MYVVWFLCVTFLLVKTQVSGIEDTTYIAAVVEYSPVLNNSVDAQTNILNNVLNYVEIIKQAGTGDIMADIVVFPEVGLTGYGNKEFAMEVPSAEDKVKPCATDTDCQPPLVQLSCAAAATSTYVVVNLAEKYHNTNQGTDEYYNTDVVFDRTGVIVARYRKIHLYIEGNKQPSPDNQLVYFDTDFGVRFGLFTCFDIIFKTPGIDLAQQYNVSHFIFPTAWFQEAPFLTGIQEQFYWAYTQNAVLLASGYNLPSRGSSGSGIYFGRQGLPVYSMKNSRGSFLQAAYVPKQLPNNGSDFWMESNATMKLLKVPNQIDLSAENLTEKLKLKRDLLEVYSTEPIIPTNDESSVILSPIDSSIYVPLIIEKSICQNSLCCQFTLNITAVYNETSNVISRGDDYSKLYYRLAVFDGVRNYDSAATGGVQTCAIIPCINSSLASCALRSDDTLATPSTIDGHTQIAIIFHTIQISGNFSNTNSSVGPNVLTTGVDDNYGALLSPDAFSFSTIESTNDTIVGVFQTKQPIDSLVTAAVYARLFSRDGEVYTGYTKPDDPKSAGFINYLDLLLLVTSFILFKCYYS